MTGVEPASSAWEADVLPMNYICNMAYHTTTFQKCKQWVWLIYDIRITVQPIFLSGFPENPSARAGNPASVPSVPEFQDLAVADPES